VQGKEGEGAMASTQAPEVEILENKEGPNNEVVYKYQGELYYVDREKGQLVKADESQLKDSDEKVIVKEGQSTSDPNASSSNRNQNASGATDRSDDASRTNDNQNAAGTSTNENNASNTDANQDASSTNTNENASGTNTGDKASSTNPNENASGTTNKDNASSSNSGQSQKNDQK
jgi:penicillin-binding protein